MQETWRDIRSILELQQALTGSQLPLSLEKTPAPETTGEPEDPTNTVDPPASSSSSEASPATSTEPEEMNKSNLFDDSTDQTPYERIEGLIPKDSPVREINSIEKLEEYVANTVLIPLDKSRTKPVFGVGRKDADLIIIGEAPGAQEDKKGQPFVGRAGQLLDKILQAIDFDREEVYITNILKSRPPRNRNPRAEEADAHLPILYKQLALIQPKIILCVGKVAGNTLLDRNSSLGSMRGKFLDFHGIPTMVTYHPAALLRNQQWKRPTWEDVKLLRSRYDELVEKS